MKQHGIGTGLLAAAIVLAVTVTACGSDGADGASAPEGEAETVRAPQPSLPPGTLAASEAGEVRLGNAPVTLALTAPSTAAERLRRVAAAGEPGRLWLVVEGVRPLRRGIYYQVYLNLPEGQAPDPGGAHFVGNLSLYGAGRGEEADQAFDVTDEVRELSATGPGPLRATFVRGNPEPDSSSSNAFMSIRRVRIEERGAT